MGVKYILDGHTVVKVNSVVEWARWFESADRHVASTTKNSVMVSTVFIGIDHSFGEGPPMLFETMIFGGEHDQYQDRCSTWEQAEAMHRAACELAFPKQMRH